jgi:hypothetical protein
MIGMGIMQYLGDIGKDLGTLSEIDSYNFYFEDFRLVFFNEPPFKIEGFSELPVKRVWYLVGTKPIVNKMGKPTTFSKPDLLISLVNLGMKIEENEALGDELALSDEVIEWCKKFGIPYEENYFRANYCRDEKGNDENKQDYINKYGGSPKTGYSGFRLGEFKRRVAVLYGYFSLWYGLVFDDIKKVIKFSPLVGHHFDVNKDFDEQLTFLKKYLPYMFSAYSHVELTVKYDEKSDKYRMVPRGTDLISVAYFQFTMLMAGMGSDVRLCIKCGKLFMLEHRGKKICPECDRIYHRDYMRGKRGKEKICPKIKGNKIKDNKKTAPK